MRKAEKKGESKEWDDYKLNNYEINKPEHVGSSKAGKKTEGRRDRRKTKVG